MLIAILPAHDEAENIGAALEAVAQQNPRPDAVWVIEDNCSDNTAEIAEEHGAFVFTTVDNEDLKAGALNQMLDVILPWLDPEDRLLIQDSDTTIGPEFISVASRKLDIRPKVGAIGAVFFGEPGFGMLGQFQRNEFIRYSRELHHQRRTDRVRVLSGTASLFRAKVLTDIKRLRLDGTIPGCGYYNAAAITEDNEITLAAMSAGWELLSPPQCVVETELMPSLRRLWPQRTRWQRGALENLKEYGWTAVTRGYILRQGAMALSVFALLAYILYTIGYVSRAHGDIGFSPWWMMVGLGFALERVVTVWKGGWKARLLAAPVFPELFYDMFQHAVFISCVIKSTLHIKQKW